MRQHKHTLEERSRRSQETSGQTSRRLQNARDGQSQRRSQETSGQTSCPLQNARDRQSQRRSKEIKGKNISISSNNMHDELGNKA